MVRFGDSFETSPPRQQLNKPCALPCVTTFEGDAGTHSLLRLWADCPGWPSGWLCVRGALREGAGRMRLRPAEAVENVSKAADD